MPIYQEGEDSSNSGSQSGNFDSLEQGSKINSLAPRYKEIVFLSGVERLTDGRWVNVAGYAFGSIQVIGMPENYPAGLSSAQKTRIIVRQSNSPTIPNSSDMESPLSGFESNALQQFFPLPKWLRVSVDIYHSGKISAYGLFVKI